MKVGTLYQMNKPVAVVFDGQSAFPLSDLSSIAAPSLREWISAPEALAEAADRAKSLREPILWASEDLAAPVLRPRKILGIGLNYLDHARETGREPPSTQTWFTKGVTALNAPFGTIDLPAVSSHLDYEAELVVVIGRKGRHVSAERAHEIIAGYTCGNDVSVRDWQRATPTMNMGKSFDTHAPVGPWIVTQDEIGPVDDLRLRTFLNGEMLQDGCVGDLIHKIPDLIAHLTAAFTLEPGDLIFTGTPAGVGVARTPQRFMKDGDAVRIEIDRIGHIEHRIVQEVAETRIG